MLVEVKKAGKEEKIIVTSLDVADTFGKEHKNVLRILNPWAAQRSLDGSILSRPITSISKTKNSRCIT